MVTRLLSRVTTLVWALIRLVAVTVMWCRVLVVVVVAVTVMWWCPVSVFSRSFRV